MEEALCGRYKYYINSYFTDCKKQASLSALFLLLQESAWKHAEEHNFGWTALSENNYSWALSRIKVCINSYPLLHDSVFLETWSKEPDALMAYRDFEMFSTDNTKILSATSAWLILNTENRKLQRISSMKHNFPISINRHAMQTTLGKLPQHSSPADPQNYPVNTIPYSAIDINGHVNNTLYLQWIIDSFPPNYIMTHDVYEAEINYLQESVLGQQYYVVIEEIAQNEYLCSVVRFHDNKALSRMILKFR
ncbi:MAG: hypothetical protein LBR10_05360 [Prevotellaceae bacterium]|jgi:acyl-ACP thioesterase|nr:hypothetical protein [Prevotellaceae bacterium]